MLDEARAHPDEIVRPAPVHAMPRLAALAGGIRCHDLVAVGDGLVHADDVIHITAKWREQLPERRALAGELDGIGN